MTPSEITILAHRLTDWEFETLLRTRVKTALDRLELVTEGETSNNRVTFSFNRYKAEWAVSTGKTYDTTTTSRGEVLGPLVSVVCCYTSNLEGTKMNLLAAPAADEDETEL